MQFQTYVDRKSRWSPGVLVVFTKKGLEDITRRLKEDLRTSFENGLKDFLKKGCLDFHFGPI